MKSNRRIGIDLAAALWILGATALGGFALGNFSRAQTVSAGGSAAQSVMPADIDPASGFRLPLLKRGALDDEGQKIYDAVLSPSSPTLSGLRGPDGILLYDPRVARLNRELNLYLRNDAGISGRIRELAILTTAREVNSQFEWTSHEPRGLKEGIEPSVLDVVRYRKSTQGLAQADAIVIQMVRELFEKNKVSSETFARALKVFGARHLVDIVALIGNYCQTAALLTSVDMQLPVGQKPLLPLP